MHEIVDTLQSLRDRQTLWALRGLVIGGFVALVASLLRIHAVGWSWVMGVHLFVYLVILVTALMGRRLSYPVRATILAAAALVIGTMGLVAWGLGGMGLMSLFTFCMLATMLFGLRPGIASAILSMSIIGVIGYCFSTGMLLLHYNPQVYMTSFLSWLSAMSSLAIMAGLIAVALGTVHQEIEKLISAMRQKNLEMAEVIARLEAEMAERIRAEKEQRELAARLQRVEKLEILGTVAAGVAHDLNNILAGSVTYPDLILRRLPEDSPLRKSIEVIRTSGTKAAAMVQDLLTLARRGVTSMVPVNLNPIIRDYFASPEYERLNFFHPQVEIDVDLDPDLPNVSGSSIHLTKVLMNLVSNAAEAMPDGGKICVASGRQCIEGESGRDFAVLTVADTGVGIPPHELEKIFEPFFTKKVLGRSGTGLGMAVVWGVVKDHGGHIDVKSEVGRGTTFTVSFPMTEEPLQEVPVSQPNAAYEGKGESILIVDDVKEQRDIAAALLRELGYRVQTAASGEEALSYLRSATADLLILDMHMAPGNGRPRHLPQGARTVSQTEGDHRQRLRRDLAGQGCPTARRRRLCPQAFLCP